MKKSYIQKLEALNALSFHFKQLNDNLNSFPNPSSFDMHCIPMDTNLESFNCRKSTEESKVTFSKSFQNEFSTLSNESLEFQKSRFSFFKKNFLNLSQDLRQIISQKAQPTREAKQEHIMQFLADCSTFEVTIQGMSFIWITHYGNTNNDCPKLDPLYREIPLERHDYKCALPYSICKANIDLDIYKPVVIEFNNQTIELTPALLMD